MFDFNSINNEINNKSNDVVNEISLDLLDINPCALFCSLYDVPITGNKVGNSEFYTIDNIINENIHDNFIAREILTSFIFNSDTAANFKLVNSIISDNDGIDILYDNVIQKYRELFSLGIYPYIYKLYEYKNDFFHIVYIGQIDSCADHFYISLNKENIINKKLSNTVINYINVLSDYKKIINNIAKSLDYNSYFKSIVTDNKSDKSKNKSNILLKKEIFKFYFNKNNKTAYFIYTIRNIFPIEFNISNSFYTNEFRHLLSLSNRPAFQMIKDNMYKNYELKCKLNDDKEVQIKITDDLQDIPDYVKSFYKINWKKDTSRTDKLRALSIKVL